MSSVTLQPEHGAQDRELLRALQELTFVGHDGFGMVWKAPAAVTRAGAIYSLGCGDVRDVPDMLSSAIVGHEAFDARRNHCDQLRGYIGLSGPHATDYGDSAFY
jgi:hypothetical protein